MTLTAERVATAEEAGLSTRRLDRITTVVESFIDRGIVAGAVTLVARNGSIAHLGAHGHMDIATDKRMATDAIFRLASMTKPIISAAILMLLEEGKILLTEPVSMYLPTFKNLHVAVPNPPAPTYVATQLAPGDYHLVPANREITLRDLLTHTSGLGSSTVGPAVAAMAALPPRQPTQTLAEIVPRMAEVPLSFQPGTVWEYSPAFGFDTLGRIVEIVSGLRLDQFLRQRVFEPLGMSDTSFAQPAEKLSRVATVYERSATGLRPATPIAALGLSTDPNNRYFSGGGGLAGTAEDYHRFGLMLSNGGHLDGERILSRKTVELMASNHIGQLPFDRPVSDLRGYRFGLGVRVLDNPAEASTLASRGTFGWAGAFNTNSWIDPAEDMVGLMLTQRMPDQTDTELRALWPRIQTTAYQAIDD
jgi:CubicO group peptidase (beta-lactamase class C family)